MFVTLITGKDVEDHICLTILWMGFSPAANRVQGCCGCLHGHQGRMLFNFLSLGRLNKNVHHQVLYYLHFGGCQNALGDCIKNLVSAIINYVASYLVPW
jgi:hypothetical protein